MTMDRDGSPHEVELAPESTAEIIPVNRLGGGSVQVSAAVTIDLMACNRDNPGNETFEILYTDEGQPAQVVATGAGVWPFPPSVYTTRYIKLTHDSNTDTVDVWVQA